MSQIQLSDSVYFDIALRLVTSLVIGGLIGLERSYHGRPAGFRTHSLVCLSTSLLILVTVYETHSDRVNEGIQNFAHRGLSALFGSKQVERWIC